MPSDQSSPNDPYHAQREALRAIKAVWEKAVKENNLDLIQPHLAAKFSIVTFTNKEFTDFAVFKAQWARDARGDARRAERIAVELPSRIPVTFGGPGDLSWRLAERSGDRWKDVFVWIALDGDLPEGRGGG